MKYVRYLAQLCASIVALNVMATGAVWAPPGSDIGLPADMGLLRPGAAAAGAPVYISPYHAEMLARAEAIARNVAACAEQRKKAKAAFTEKMKREEVARAQQYASRHLAVVVEVNALMVKANELETTILGLRRELSEVRARIARERALSE